MGTFPVAAEPGLRENREKEAAGVASIRSTAKAIFTEVFGMGKLHRDSRERRMREADVGSPPAATIKLKFRKAFRCGRSGGKCLHRSCASAGQERGKFPRGVQQHLPIRRRRAIHEPRDRIGIWLVGRNTGLMEMAAGIVERTFSESPR
jgi:hypothetical protein